MLLARARTAGNNNNKAATAFTFKLMDYEKKYMKMIEYIGSYTPYHLILQYVEPMALTDKTSLLKAIIDKSEGFFRLGNDIENDHEVFPQLLSSLLKFYKQEYLMAAVSNAVKQKYFYTPNNFIRYLLSCWNTSVTML